MSNLEQNSKHILELIDEIQAYESYKKNLFQILANLDYKHQKRLITDQQYSLLRQKYLKAKSFKENITNINSYILKLLNEIKQTNLSLFDQISIEPTQIKEIKPIQDLTIKPTIIKQIESLDVNINDIKKFVQKQKKKKEVVEKEKYTVYQSNNLAKISSKLLNKLSNHLTQKYPQFFKRLYNSINVSNIKILSKAYINIMLFFSVIMFILSFIISLFFFKGNIAFIIIKSFLLALILSIITFVIVYFYPESIIKSKQRKMKDELPFAIIHMAAIAGSGAQPINMFKLLLESNEYKALNSEFKKVLNYTNLFGYDFLTALKSVASTTPSYDFKELLNGIIASTETGGDIKTYLNDKGKEALNNYRLQRKKYVDSLAAYSDIYTGILIAAPLLFIVTLAIINVIGGKVGTFSVEALARIGTFVFIPFLNIAFLLFINIMQPHD